MVTIDWDALDDKNQEAYLKFEKQLEELTEKYKREDSERFKIIEDMVAQKEKGIDWDLGMRFNNKTGEKIVDPAEKEKGIDWDLRMCFNNKPGEKIVDPAAVLLYEYCLAGELITHQKVSFEKMAKRLLEEQDIIRLGNPIPETDDDDFLYGQGLTDKTAMPITSRKYRIVFPGGAQHLSNYKDGKYRQALFMYEKGKRTYYEAQMDAEGKIKKTENGEVEKTPKVKGTTGTDFYHVAGGQTLLTHFRQILFHELNHTLLDDFINPGDEKAIQYEYVGPDGVKYRNYNIHNSYLRLDPNALEEEPEYFVIKDKNGNILLDSYKNPSYFYEDENGDVKPIDEYHFPMSDPIKLEEPICKSGCLTTYEVTPEGKEIIINRVEEGFVEEMARAMVMAIDKDTQDLETELYSTETKIANTVVKARDKSLGVDGPGSTHAVLLTHSSVFKQELESVVVSKDKSVNR